MATIFFNYYLIMPVGRSFIMFSFKILSCLMMIVEGTAADFLLSSDISEVWLTSHKLHTLMIF